MKEKSKVELIERELKSREQMMRVILSEKSRQLKEAVSRAEAAERKAYDDLLNHQDQVEMYQVRLHEKEAEAKEKEESNQLLRRDMLEIMNRQALFLDTSFWRRAFSSLLYPSSMS